MCFTNFDLTLIQASGLFFDGLGVVLIAQDILEKSKIEYIENKTLYPYNITDNTLRGTLFLIVGFLIQIVSLLLPIIPFSIENNSICIQVKILTFGLIMSCFLIFNYHSKNKEDAQEW